eukprot:TRINITY_DN30417_c0_g1_i1.p1 TRINITY_DN30417_c0_g1~~TRINITY_DN30417_c0_g1_i1.p1  ORF type:complete len:745 (+),score=92.85 TRINITY_DN30417_c0_g1_i1:83-2317(+)
MTVVIEERDQELLRELALEIERNGGEVAASELLLYNRRLRSLLGDRKLLGFVQQHTGVFSVRKITDTRHYISLLPGYKDNCAVGSFSPSLRQDNVQYVAVEASAKTVTCNQCGDGFVSRNALFKHLAVAHGGGQEATRKTTIPASAANPQSAKALERELIAGLRYVLNARTSGETQVRLDWVATIPRVRAALTHWLRAEIDAGAPLPRLAPRTKEWWAMSTVELLKFVRERPATFIVGPDGDQGACHDVRVDGGNEALVNHRSADEEHKSLDLAASENTSDQPRLYLRKTRFGLTQAAVAAAEAEDAETLEPLRARVALVLRTMPALPGKPRYAAELLGEVAKDTTVQRLLHGRLLLRALAGDARFELGEDPKRGSTIRLASRADRDSVTSTCEEPCEHLSKFKDESISPAKLPEGCKDVNAIDVSSEEEYDESKDAGVDTPTTQQQARTTDDDDRSPAVVLSRADGTAAVLEKPCGTTTEQLVLRFQRDEMKKLYNQVGTPSQEPYKIKTVSRLDAPTSGAIIVPLCSAAESTLKDCFARRTVQKAYLALVIGEAPFEGVIDVKLRAVQTVDRYRAVVHPYGKPSVTAYRRLALLSGDSVHPNYSLLLVWPLTGRMHQIRAHMAHLGYPLAGDMRYAPRKHGTDWCGKRLFLHAAHVAVDVAGADSEPWSLSAVASLPADLREPLEILGVDANILKQLDEPEFYLAEASRSTTIASAEALAKQKVPVDRLQTDEDVADPALLQ